MTDFDAWIGRAAVSSGVVTPDLIARFRATFDLGVDDGDDALPPGLHWCIAPESLPTSELAEDGHPRRGDDSFLPPIPLPRRMWAGGDVHFLRPLPVGADVQRVSRVVEIAEKRGTSGTLCFVGVEHALSAEGEVCIRERQDIVYRAASAPGATPPRPRSSGPHRSSPAMLFRYSSLTFNAHRIHYDRPYAVDVEGHRDLVVHGPLQATLLLQAACRTGPPPRRFAFRGVAPLFVDDGFDIRVEPGDGRIELSVVLDTRAPTMTAVATG